MISRERCRVIGRRLLQVVPVILLVTFFSFLLLHLSPVDPALLLAGENPTEAQIAEISHLPYWTGMGSFRPSLASSAARSCAFMLPRRM